MSKMGREFLRQQEQKFLYGRQGMKVLRIYDHLGELKKELNLYVEGGDFKWQSSYPEPVWLGTITLEEPGKEPEKPTESVSELLQPEPEITEEREADEVAQELAGQKDEGTPEFKEVKDEPKKNDRKRSRVKRSTPSASPERTQVIRQDDSGGDTTQGD